MRAHVWLAALTFAMMGCGGDGTGDDDAGDDDTLEPGWADAPTVCAEIDEMRVPIDGGPHDGDDGPVDPHAEVYGDEPDPVNVNLGFFKDPWSSAGVTWETGTATLSSVMEIRTDERGPIQLEGKTYELDNLGGDPPVSRLHEVWICDLLPSTRYTYRVGGPGAWSNEFRFTTAPAPGATPHPFRFVVLGDSNFGYVTWGALTTAIAAHEPDFVIHTGDVLQKGNSQLEWMAWFDGGADMLGWYPLLTAHGNHDELARLYFGHFVHPGNEEYYSFDWSNAHFVVLNDSEREDDFYLEEEVDFLRGDLAEAYNTWTFVFHHRPPYCSRDGGNTTIRNAWAPSYDEHHVDIVFNGHWHLYERTVPIWSEQEAASHAEGTTYVVTGGAGAAGYECGEEWFTHVCEETFNFVVVDIDGSDLQLTAYRKDGSVLDSFEIHK